MYGCERKVMRKCIEKVSLCFVITDMYKNYNTEKETNTGNETTYIVGKSVRYIFAFPHDGLLEKIMCK